MDIQSFSSEVTKTSILAGVLWLLIPVSAQAAFSANEPNLVVSSAKLVETGQVVCNTPTYYPVFNAEGVVANTGSVSREVMVYFRSACRWATSDPSTAYTYGQGIGRTYVLPANSSMSVSNQFANYVYDVDCIISVCIGPSGPTAPDQAWNPDDFPCESAGPVYIRQLQPDGSCTNTLSSTADTSTTTKKRGRKK